jgi:renalase
MKSCLAVGAGMAGLTAAHALQRNGWRVLLLDKGRGVGGRMATRRVRNSRFDHGAQFFTVRDARFAEAVAQWESAGWVVPWHSEGGHVRYRGADRGLDIRTQTTVTRVESAAGGWLVATDAGEELRADALVMTAPVPQSLALLAGCMEQLPTAVVTTLRGIAYDPCFALMVTLAGASAVPAPGFVRPENDSVAFIADNVQKGISTGVGALTIHATPEFTRRYFEASRDEVARMLIEAATPWLGSAAVSTQLHRWKFSQPVGVTSEACVVSDVPGPIAFAGDAFAGPRVEGAFLSGLAAGEWLSLRV